MGHQFAQQPQMANWITLATTIPRQAPEISRVEDNPEMGKWTRDLRESAIILTMPNGQAIRYDGHEFGSLTDPPARAMQHLFEKATNQGGFDPTRQVIITGDNLPISAEVNFISGLAAVIRSGDWSGARLVHWRVQDKDPFPMPQQFHPPPRGPQPIQPPASAVFPGFPQHRPGSRPQSIGPISPNIFFQQPVLQSQLANPSPLLQNGFKQSNSPPLHPPLTSPRILQQPSTQSAAAVGEARQSSAERPSPLLTKAAQPLLPVLPSMRENASQELNRIAPALRGGETSQKVEATSPTRVRSPAPLQNQAPVRATTPNGASPGRSSGQTHFPGFSINGASSSPNLKNLMHSH